MGLSTWADARKTRPGAQELERRLLEPPNGTAGWTIDAWATAACWSALLDHFSVLATAAREGDAQTCGIQIQHIDQSLEAVSLLLSQIPLPGAGSCTEAVVLIRAEFGAGDLPDPELMDHVGDWIANAITAGNSQDHPFAHPTA